jgi:hypothetical protein
MVGADERAGRRQLVYAPASVGGDLFDYQVAITASTPRAARRVGGRDPRSVKVRGHDATLVTLTDEGQEYGFSVFWDERSDLRIVVEGSNGPTEQQTLAVAEDVHSISTADWQTLLVEFSLDTHVGQTDPNARAVEALGGTVDGDDYVLTALVPSGYPLGEADRRLDCFHLSFGGETTKDYCPGHPVWARVGGRIFVFGDVAPDVTNVRISALNGSTFDPFMVDTVAMSSGPPTSFYVAALPQAACSVSVDDANGPGGPGATGPLAEAGADYTRCTGRAPGQPPNSPTTTN